MSTPKPLQRLPLFLDLSACRVLLVGGGRTAEAKLGPLRDAGARILSVSLRHHDGFLREAERRGGVDLLREPFHPSHLDGVRLAVSATDDPAVNARVAREARRRDIFCNAVDDPEYCDAYFASIFRRGPWHLAIGTQGAFPGLSAALRGLLDQLIPEDHGATLEELACLRRRLKAALPDPDLRRRRLERLLAAFRRTYFPSQETQP
jgi:precorrin-2 dehydrogenase/sirohydrochlorin ferrochelatase